MAIKTVSLETAKLLKDAGFKKECHFGFVDGELECNPSPTEWPIYAPTSDELLEELIGKRQVKITWMSRYEHWLVSFRLDVDEFKGFENKSLPEALASLWLWLKKENLI